MASLELRGKKYAVIFRFGGLKFSRSLKTSSEVEARSRLSRLEENLRLVEAGRLILPDDADPATFLLSDGNINQKPRLRRLTIGELFEKFFLDLPENTLEKNTLGTMKIHQRHLVRKLGEKFDVPRLSLADLQGYVRERSQEDGQRGKKIGAATIKKEIATFRVVWNWAMDHKLVTGPFPNKGLRMPKTVEHPPFQTWDEIEHLVQGMEEVEAKAYWDCLYLRVEETEEILNFVQEQARHPFIYPMFVTAAHTGARRSEILRSQISDIQRDTLLIREKKRRKGQESTRRVPISGRLRTALDDWLENHHPGGGHTFGYGEMVRSRTRKSNVHPITGDEAQDHFNRTLQSGKWKVLRGWHCFRHSFISNLASQGVDQRLIDEFVGHTSEEIRRRYRHLLPDVKQAAIQSVFG
ncbi:site-specific integrase [Bremerella sp. JC770]|uniref:tyrosine-type recombinase/integrase n=1 Tax=Bremerella sp. JC770 TaxID=3232137 RepID=UPI003459972F